MRVFVLIFPAKESVREEDAFCLGVSIEKQLNRSKSFSNADTHRHSQTLADTRRHTEPEVYVWEGEQVCRRARQENSASDGDRWFYSTLTHSILSRLAHHHTTPNQPSIATRPDRPTSHSSIQPYTPSSPPESLPLFPSKVKAVSLVAAREQHHSQSRALGWVPTHRQSLAPSFE